MTEPKTGMITINIWAAIREVTSYTAYICVVRENIHTSSMDVFFLGLNPQPLRKFQLSFKLSFQNFGF